MLPAVATAVAEGCTGEGWTAVFEADGAVAVAVLLEPGASVGDGWDGEAGPTGVGLGVGDVPEPHAADRSVVVVAMPSKKNRRVIRPPRYRRCIVKLLLPWCFDHFNGAEERTTDHLLNILGTPFARLGCVTGHYSMTPNTTHGALSIPSTRSGAIHTCLRPVKSWLRFISSTIMNLLPSPAKTMLWARMVCFR